MRGAWDVAVCGPLYMTRRFDRDSLLTILVLLVATTWAFVTLASMLTKDYRDLTIITPVMVLVAGGFFTFDRRRR